MSTRMDKLPKLLKVFHESDVLEPGQMPVVVDDRMLVMDMRSIRIVCDHQKLNKKMLNHFDKNWTLFELELLESTLNISKKELFLTVCQEISCLPCRKDAENFFHEVLKLDESVEPLAPLLISKKGKKTTVTLKEEKRTSKIMANIFHNHVERMKTVKEAQPRWSKKICKVHAVKQEDKPVVYPVSGWVRKLWNSMTPECRNKVCTIEATSLYLSLKLYWKKYKFCCSCVCECQRAFVDMLKLDVYLENHTMALDLTGISFCFVPKFLEESDRGRTVEPRYEPVFLCSTNHERSMPQALDEVTTCMSLFIFERLHRINLRVAEQTRICHLLAEMAILTMHRKFEKTAEELKDADLLTMLVKQIEQQDKAKEKKSEEKRMRRQRQKEKLAYHSDNDEADANAESTLTPTPPNKTSLEINETPIPVPIDDSQQLHGPDESENRCHLRFGTSQNMMDEVMRRLQILHRNKLLHFQLPPEKTMEIEKQPEETMKIKEQFEEPKQIKKQFEETMEIEKQPEETMKVEKQPEETMEIESQQYEEKNDEFNEKLCEFLLDLFEMLAMLFGMSQRFLKFLFEEEQDDNENEALQRMYAFFAIFFFLVYGFFLLGDELNN